MKIHKNHSLKQYNTFGVEAKANAFAEVNSIEDIREIIGSPSYSKNKALILGGGSNILFTGDYPGLIIKNNIKGIKLLKEDDHYFYLKAGAGENWHEFVLYCIDKGYAGIENLSLIPGNVGASPMQNIGAYGVEVKDVVWEVEALDLKSGEILHFTNEECDFGYRTSIFKTRLKGQVIITHVTYRLYKNPRINTSYGAVEKELEGMGVDELNIKAVSKAICNIRRKKLPDPSITGNAGSFFKNPVVSADFYQKLIKEHPDMPSYKLSDKKYKLAAGWLIEQCGWKGKRMNAHGVHKNQALVLVNYGNARGEDIYNLSCEILESVRQQFDIELEREVNVI